MQIVSGQDEVAFFPSAEESVSLLPEEAFLDGVDAVCSKVGWQKRLEKSVQLQLEICTYKEVGLLLQRLKSKMVEDFVDKQVR